MWSTITISNMLKNPVYVGDMTQGRNRVKSYKINKIEAVPLHRVQPLGVLNTNPVFFASRRCRIYFCRSDGCPVNIQVDFTKH